MCDEAPTIAPEQGPGGELGLGRAPSFGDGQEASDDGGGLGLGQDLRWRFDAGRLDGGRDIRLVRLQILADLAGGARVLVQHRGTHPDSKEEQGEERGERVT